MNEIEIFYAIGSIEQSLPTRRSIPLGDTERVLIDLSKSCCSRFHSRAFLTMR
jgi:hypothetical protein